MSTPVRLRLIGPGDVEALAAMFADPEAAGEQNWFGFRPDNVQRLRARVAAGETVGDGYGALAVEAADGTLVGEVSWHASNNSTPPNGRCWNVGIWVLPAHRGHGYGSAAQRAEAPSGLSLGGAARRYRGLSGAIRAQAAARSRSRVRSRSLRVSDAARSNSTCASSRRPSFTSRSPRTLGSRW